MRAGSLSLSLAVSLSLRLSSLSLSSLSLSLSLLSLSLSLVCSQLRLDLWGQGVHTLWGSFEIKNVRLAAKMIQQHSRVSLRSRRVVVVVVVCVFLGEKNDAAALARATQKQASSKGAGKVKDRSLKKKRH